MNISTIHLVIMTGQPHNYTTKKMLLSAGLLLTMAVSIHARNFSNPIIGTTDFREPGMIKVNGTYYLVTSTYKTTTDRLEIHVSTNLVNWTSAGHVFTNKNLPNWSRKDQAFRSPEIHKIGCDYHIYFTAIPLTTSYYGIGVAVAEHPLGPYTTTDRPLLTNLKSSYDSTIINDNENIYLVWTNGSIIKARKLDYTGLTFSSEETFDLLRIDLNWEASNIDGPSYIRRGKYHYLLYSANNPCNESYSIGVARSLNSLGPYEKHCGPILITNNYYYETGQGSIVKDLNDQNDVLVFHGSTKFRECSTRLTLLASLGWGADGWPHVYDF